MRALRSSSGQGTVEYLGAVAVVATLLVVSGAALAHAADISRRVTREWARALCLVRGGDCRRDREPCVVAARGRRRQTEVNLLVYRVGGGATVLAEQRSDGTVAVTRILRDLAGLDVGLGADATARLGPVDLAVGGEARAAALAALGDGETWILPSRAAGDAFVARLREDVGRRTHRHAGTPEPPPLPPPDETFGEQDVSAAVTASLGIAVGDEDLAGASAGAGGDAHRTARVDRRTGRRTIYFGATRSAEVAATLGGGLLGEWAGAASGGERLAVELDRAGRPVDLQVIAAGAFGGSRDLPGAVQPVAGRLSVPARGARRYQVTAHLDLTDRANLAAARPVLRQLLLAGAVPGRATNVSGALRERLRRAGDVEARVFEEVRSGWGASGHVAVGPKLGVGHEREEWSSRLLAAASRGLDGQWLVREDCVAAG